ncbi:hypothetical protein EVAR_49785_1 [Eumeta japonica]|uniref:Uncharacterized protein n=1 Tax=Eumeta variegata TaxID=151549 RepID=A0A4C1Y1F9_EUMVA|nr:hypothetical protein EVAR_49785_1 [Eumeta japonica]
MRISARPGALRSRRPPISRIHKFFNNIQLGRDENSEEVRRDLGLGVPVSRTFWARPFSRRSVRPWAVSVADHP